MWFLLLYKKHEVEELGSWGESGKTWGRGKKVIKIQYEKILKEEEHVNILVCKYF